jgi:hypothetical protein
MELSLRFADAVPVTDVVAVSNVVAVAAGNCIRG